MTTKLICMVNGIRLQKDFPKSDPTCTGVRPMNRAATQTMTTAIAANI